MTVEIRVPTMGESITEATVGEWFKKAGDPVSMDEPLVELETDKVTLEVNATAAGVLADISAESGATVEIGALLGTINDNAEAVAPEEKTAPKAKAEAAAKPKAAAKAEAEAAPPKAGAEVFIMPAARKLAEEHGVDPAAVKGSGRDGRVTKGDVLAAIEGSRSTAAEAPPTATPVTARGPRPETEREERVPMTRLRKTIALRLKEAQNTAAMLTTFNEVDMTEIMTLRKEYRDDFEQKHGTRLGFMSFFVKAAVGALRELPAVNAEIDGDDIVYKNYYHIGVAVGTPQGLVVPVLKDADAMSFADIEKALGELGARARDGKLAIDEMLGGTFTISNGGVYGSLMSTPILNPPQSGILGMHRIQNRPMDVAGEIKLRPMMYLALSYDHRIVDGREAVTFLVRIKETLEDPRRLMLDL